MDDLVSGLVAFALVGLLWLCVGVPIDAKACRARWEHSGHATKYGVFSGCLVQGKDGLWRPEENVREVGQ